MVYNFVYRTGVPSRDTPDYGHARLFVELLRTDVDLLGPGDPLGLTDEQVADALRNCFSSIDSTFLPEIKAGPWNVLIYKYDYDRIAFRYAIDVEIRQQRFVDNVVRDCGEDFHLFRVCDSVYAHGPGGIQRREKCGHPTVGKGVDINHIPIGFVSIWTADARQCLKVPQATFLNWSAPRGGMLSDGPKRGNKGGHGGKRAGMQNRQMPPPPVPQRARPAAWKPVTQMVPPTPVAGPSTLPAGPSAEPFYCVLDAPPSPLSSLLPSKPLDARREESPPNLHELAASLANGKRPETAPIAPTSLKGKEKAVGIVEDNAEAQSRESAQPSGAAETRARTAESTAEPAEPEFTRETSPEDEAEVLSELTPEDDEPLSDAESNAESNAEDAEARQETAEDIVKDVLGIKSDSGSGKRKRADSELDLSELQTVSSLQYNLDKTSAGLHKVAVDHRRWQAESDGTASPPKPTRECLDELFTGLGDTLAPPPKRLRLDSPSGAEGSAEARYLLTYASVSAAMKHKSVMLGCFVGGVAAMWVTLSRSSAGEE